MSSSPHSPDGGGARHLHRVAWSPRGDVDLARWPFTVPAVRQFVDDGGMDIAAGATLLVGANGTGKSTLIEAFAAAYPRQGADSPHVNVVGAHPREEDSPLRWHVRAVTHPLASPAGFFLRSEVLHDYLTSIDAERSGTRAFGGARLTARSHGEAVLTVLRHRFDEPGVYFCDEPENALSFEATLGLVAVLADIVEAGGQVVAATHSPLLTALPGATLLELGEWGIRRTTWDDLDVVAHWRAFLDDPARYLRHLAPQPDDP